MANIDAELNAIMQAIRGEDVRGSIHNAIEKINDVENVQIDAGTSISDGDGVGNPPNGYENSVYIRTDTGDILKCNGNVWHKVSNLTGASITSITGPVSEVLADTYTIHITKDGDPVLDIPFTVNNGKGITEITGPVTEGLIDTYTIHYNDDSSTTFEVHHGKGISSIVKSSLGLIDTYTITYNDGTTYTFDLTNGKGISSITGPEHDGLDDIYTINYNDGTTGGFRVHNGNGIQDIRLTSSVGVEDIYTITFTDGTEQELTTHSGNRIFRGTAISGKGSTSFIAQGYVSNYCRIGDTYININTGDVYGCTKNGVSDGDGVTDPTKALWKYDFTLVGGGYITSTLSSMEDVNLDNPQNGNVLSFVMMPDPSDPSRTVGMWTNSNQYPTKTEVDGIISTKLQDKVTFTDNGAIGSKNIIPYPFKDHTKTENGLTFTDSSDGIISVSGTATADTEFLITEEDIYNKTINLDKDTWVINGLPANSGLSTYYYQVHYIDSTNAYTVDNIESNETQIVKRQSKDHLGIKIVIKEGVTIPSESPIIFSPMLRLATDKDATWRPYAMRNRDLTLFLGGEGLSTKYDVNDPVVSNNNIADNDRFPLYDESEAVRARTTWGNIKTKINDSVKASADTTPTSGSANLITSGGVYTYIDTVITQALTGSY